MNENHAPGGARTALYIGVVVDTADPHGLGRIRARIPGITESSGWAFPLATAGGGSSSRGGFVVPKKGAEVGIMFNGGDIDAPYYLGGHWGIDEPPAFVRTIDPVDADKVLVWEGDRYEVVVDERPGKEMLRLRDKKSNDEILLDGVKRGINIAATSLVHIESKGAVSIDAPAVTIAGRPVLPNGKSI